MYKQRDKSQSIREIQNQLSAILTPTNYIAENGIYDIKTEEAIREFQRSQNLSVSGIVDFQTRNLLYNEYLKVKKRDIVNRSSTYLAFPIMPQDRNYGMKILSRTIATLMEYYGYSHSIRESEYYTPQLVEAVKSLRGIYMMEDSEHIDEALYMAITRDFNSIAKKNNFK